MNGINLCREPRTPNWRIAALAIVFVANPGCSSFDGLRSIAANRPSLVARWDRGQNPAPEPADDLYARTMNGGSRIGGTTTTSDDGAGENSNSARNDTTLQRIPDVKNPPSNAVADNNKAGKMQDETVIPNVDGRRVQQTSDLQTKSELQVALGNPQPLQVGEHGISGASAPAIPPVSRERRHADVQLDQRHSETSQSGQALAATSDRRHDDKTHALNAGKLLEQAENHINSLQSYQVKMKRTERVRGRLQAEEDVLMSVRREPKAVRFEWADGANKGREVIYSTAADPHMLFVHMPSGALSLPTMKISVDSPMVTSNSRHSITEAGLDRIIRNLRKSIADANQGTADRNDLIYNGLEAVPGLNQTGHRFTHRTPLQETWTVYLDSKTLLPILVFAKDAKGELVERYRYQDFRENPNELATADAFDPDRRWGNSRGMFSRLTSSSTSNE